MCRSCSDLAKLLAASCSESLCRQDESRLKRICFFLMKCLQGWGLGPFSRVPRWPSSKMACNGKGRIMSRWIAKRSQCRSTFNESCDQPASDLCSSSDQSNAEGPVPVQWASSVTLTWMGPVAFSGRDSPSRASRAKAPSGDPRPGCRSPVTLPSSSKQRGSREGGKCGRLPLNLRQETAG